MVATSHPTTRRRLPTLPTSSGNLSRRLQGDGDVTCELADAAHPPNEETKGRGDLDNICRSLGASGQPGD